MMIAAKITSKGQITLPKEVRRLLSVDTGSVIVFETEDDHVILRPTKSLQEFRGFLRGRKTPESLDELRRVVKSRVGKRIGGHKR
jgi:antitoxin PrlF